MEVLEAKGYLMGMSILQKETKNIKNGKKKKKKDGKYLKIFFLFVIALRQLLYKAKILKSYSEIYELCRSVGK